MKGYRFVKKEDFIEERLTNYDLYCKEKYTLYHYYRDYIDKEDDIPPEEIQQTRLKEIKQDLDFINLIVTIKIKI